MNDNPYQSPLAEELDCSLSDGLQFLFGLALLAMNIVAAIFMLYFGIDGILCGVLWQALFYTLYGVCELALSAVFVIVDPCMSRNLWRKRDDRAGATGEWVTLGLDPAPVPPASVTRR